jgi:hypothetical protein
MNRYRELRQRCEHLQNENTDYQKLVDLLRSRDHKEANVILDMLQQNSSVHEVLRQVEHGDMLCELSVVSEDRYVLSFLVPSPCQSSCLARETPILTLSKELETAQADYGASRVLGNFHVITTGVGFSRYPSQT